MNKAFIFVLGGSAAIISIVGACFSIAGLTKVFAGAPIAVGIMAAALELCKMMAASFLHNNWSKLHLIMKGYMTIAVGVLMCITSMGIFGYLSYAYQSTAQELKKVIVDIDSLDSQHKRVQADMERDQKIIDDIPANRVTKRLEMQKELEPTIQAHQKQLIEIQMNLRNANMKKLAYSVELGPVTYVAELIRADMDHVATYLILLFVFVFDPLAVCMVLATNFALQLRKEEDAESKAAETAPKAAA